MVGGDEENYAIQIRHVVNGKNTLCIPVQNIERWINNLCKNIYFLLRCLYVNTFYEPWLHLHFMFDFFILLFDI